MIQFNYNTEFLLDNPNHIKKWISQSIDKESYKLGDINYIFSNDEYLYELNVKYLNHNTLTDIISFDDTMGKLLSGDIFISIERVKENAKEYKTVFEDELHRVMIHGILHFCGYKDKTIEDKQLMRKKEDYYLSLREF